MYEERRETFSIRDIILQILLIVLFVLLLIWIFPTKGYMKKFVEKNFGNNTNTSETVKVEASADDIDKLSVLYNQIFADNVAKMKDAAIGYYTNERLPKNVGDTEKMTLNEMYNKHLLLKLTDKNGNYCDAEKSYVSITKYKNEYQMKVNLSCGSEEDYIIVYLGCYDYCEATGVCEKKETQPVNPTPSNPTCTYKNGKYYDNNGKVVSKAAYEKACKSTPAPSNPTCTYKNGKYYDNKGNVVSKAEYEKACTTPTKYVCEYQKTSDGYWGPYGEWSAWTKSKITSGSAVQVETKTEKEITGYKTEKKQTGTKTETYIKGYNDEKYISGYKTEKYISGYTTEKYITGYTTEKYVSGYTTEKYISGYKETQVQTGTKTEKYISGYKTEKVLTGYKTEKVQTGTTTEKYIKSYTTQKVAVGTKQVISGYTTKTVTKKVASGTTNKYVSSGSGSTVPSNGNGYIYVKTGSKTSQSCSSCAVKTTYTWDVYQVVTVYKTVTTTEQVPVYKTETIYETKQVPVYGTRTVPVYTTKQVAQYETKKTPIYSTRTVPVYKTETTPVYSTRKVPVYSTRKVPVYGTKKVPVYSTKKTPIYSTRKVPVYGTREVPVYSEVKVPIYSQVTYYRSRTRIYIGDKTDTKWSTCDPVDQSLINAGYSLTGNKKAA